MRTGKVDFCINNQQKPRDSPTNFRIVNSQTKWGHSTAYHLWLVNCCEAMHKFWPSVLSRFVQSSQQQEWWHTMLRCHLSRLFTIRVYTITSKDCTQFFQSRQKCGRRQSQLWMVGCCETLQKHAPPIANFANQNCSFPLCLDRRSSFA